MPATPSDTDYTFAYSRQSSELKLSVPGLLREAAVTYEERGALYGHNYKEPLALVMAGLQEAANFKPNEMSTNDWSRLGILVQIAYKLTRYANLFHKGGQVDAAHDLCVYAAMLEELTRDNVYHKQP